MKYFTEEQMETINYQSYLLLLDMLMFLSVNAYDRSNMRYESANRFAIKIIYHAITLKSIYEGLTYTSPNFPDGKSIYDFMSVPILTRSVLDTYLYFWEIYVEPDNDEKSKWLRDCYYLNAFYLREKFQDSFNLDKKLLLEAKLKDLDDMRNRITKSTFFKSLKPKTKRRVRKEGGIFPHRSIKRKALAAGYHEDFIKRRILVLHDYTHGGGLSISHTDIFRNDSDMKASIMHNLVVVSTAMARMIMSYVESFEKAKDWYRSLEDEERTTIERYIAISTSSTP